jgi:hypothetical protein
MTLNPTRVERATVWIFLELESEMPTGSQRGKNGKEAGKEHTTTTPRVLFDPSDQFDWRISALFGYTNI